MLTAFQPQRVDLASERLPTTALALLRDHAVQDWRDVIARMDVPSLLVAGRDSELWPSEHAAAAAAFNPQARVAVIDDCGHAVNAEQPDSFNALLGQFLTQVASS